MYQVFFKQHKDRMKRTSSKWIGRKAQIVCVCVAICAVLCCCTDSTDRDRARAQQMMQQIEACLGNQDTKAFSGLFAPNVASGVAQADIDAVLAAFPQGITVMDTEYDDGVTATDWVEDDTYVKNIDWFRMITDNQTGEIYVINVLQCTVHWTDQDEIGIIRIILYPEDAYDAFTAWWDAFAMEDRPVGIVLFEN